MARFDYANDVTDRALTSCGVKANDLVGYRRIIDAFLAGHMPGMNHVRHIAVANILRRLPYGRELMHLGIQVTSTRGCGVPEKYSRETTETCWEKVAGPLPPLFEFADILEER